MSVKTKVLSSKWNNKLFGCATHLQRHVIQYIPHRHTTVTHTATTQLAESQSVPAPPAAPRRSCQISSPSRANLYTNISLGRGAVGAGSPDECLCQKPISVLSPYMGAVPNPYLGTSCLGWVAAMGYVHIGSCAGMRKVRAIWSWFFKIYSQSQSITSIVACQQIYYWWIHMY